MVELIQRVYAGDPVTGNNIPGISPVAGDVTTIGGLVSVIITWIAYIVGVLAFFYLVYSGILYITANGNPDQAKKGQQGIINAIIGIIIVILAVTIINVAKNVGLGAAQNADNPSTFDETVDVE